MPFFQELEYVAGKGYISYEFNKAMLPYILNFNESFVKYHIKNILEFNSKYSIGIYELCKNELKSNRNKRTEKSISLEELREWLQTPKSYQKYENMKSNLLDKTCYDITFHSDIALNFREIKEGKKVIGITFLITKNYEDVNNKICLASLLALTRSMSYMKNEKVRNSIKEQRAILNKREKKYLDEIKGLDLSVKKI
jgi:plasmid replication initiation protein